MIDIYSLFVYALSYIGLFLLSFYLLSFSSRAHPLSEKKPLVTILIPAYNEAASIVPTLESAWKLDYPRDKLEIIVIDDGSTDATLSHARSFADSHRGVRVIHQRNGGKANALNTGIAQARGEIIVSMDADTFVSRDSLGQMISHFRDSSVMAVASSVTILRPRTFWQRVQHIEYYLTVFFRRALSFTNSIYITAGAYSAYRASFFAKYGGYAEGTITEDLEMALRIQSHDYTIEYAPHASAQTIGPASFKELLYQRRRWYTGLVRNLWNYRSTLFGRKKGTLGLLILPSVVLSIVLSLLLTFFTLSRALSTVIHELSALQAIDFRFLTLYELNSYLFERIFFTFFSNPLYLFVLFFIIASVLYLRYARRVLGFKESLVFNYIIFIFVYALLFSFWWIVSLVYVAFNRNVRWRGS